MSKADSGKVKFDPHRLMRGSNPWKNTGFWAFPDEEEGGAGRLREELQQQWRASMKERIQALRVEQAHPEGIACVSDSYLGPENNSPQALQILEGLNEEQKAAVRGCWHNTLILAGAGTGKTTTLTARLAWLLGHGVPPSSIDAVTFTRRAARAMKEKLGALVGESLASAVRIQTFHGMAWGILRRHMRDTPVRILSETAQERIVTHWREEYKQRAQDEIRKRALQELEFCNEDGAFDESSLTPEQLRDLKRTEAKLARQHKTPVPSVTDCLKFIQAVKELEIDVRKQGWQLQPGARRMLQNLRIDESVAEQQSCVKCFEHYQEQLQESRRLDFPDVLLRTRDLLKESREAREAVMRETAHILLDEAQDTDPLQYAILQYMTRDYAWLDRQRADCLPTVVTAVGDDDQSIYAFRHASPEVMHAFLEHYQAEQITLVKNYRSLGHILQVAQQVISCNDDRLENKRLMPMRTAPSADPLYEPCIEVTAYTHMHAESEGVAASIHQLLQKPQVRPGEVAVLARTNRQLTPLENALAQKGVPFLNLSGFGYFKRREIKQAMLWLDAASQPDTVNILDALEGFDYPGIGTRFLSRLEDEARQKQALNLMQPMLKVLHEYAQKWKDFEPRLLEAEKDLERAKQVIAQWRAAQPEGGTDKQPPADLRKAKQNAEDHLKKLVQSQPDYDRKPKRQAWAHLAQFTDRLTLAVTRLAMASLSREKARKAGGPAWADEDNPSWEVGKLVRQLLEAGDLPNWADQLDQRTHGGSRGASSPPEGDAEDEASENPAEAESEGESETLGRRERLKSFPGMVAGYVKELRQDLLREDSQGATLDQLIQAFLCSHSLGGTQEEDLREHNKVILQTVHGAKGLEYAHVYVIGMSEGIFPSMRASDRDKPAEGEDKESVQQRQKVKKEEVIVKTLLEDRHNDPDYLQKVSEEAEEFKEERRLAYVAFTRAMHSLHLSLYLKSKASVNEFDHKPSRFLMEFYGGYKRARLVQKRKPLPAFRPAPPRPMPPRPGVAR